MKTPPTSKDDAVLLLFNLQCVLFRHKSVTRLYGMQPHQVAVIRGPLLILAFGFQF